MRILAFSVLALGVGLVSVQLSACSSSADDCNATATCGATPSGDAGSAGKSGGSDHGGSTTGGTVGSGGSSGTSGTAGTMGSGGDGGSSSSSCSGDVSTESACWTNELGVFVSSDSGDDATGNGTKEAPFKTISKGVGAAAGKNVYVCVGAKDYKEETITLNAASDGVRIYGGFECAGWTYATTRSAQVVSDSNIALRIDGLKKGATIENVSFQAADANGSGVDASSYGAFVTNSKKVVLTRVNLTAGAGAAGAKGADGMKGADALDAGPAPAGEAALCGTPPDGKPGTWTVATCGSKGGNGGAGVVDTDGANGNSGTPIANVDPPNQVNRGEGAASPDDGGNGTKGANGNPGASAAPADDAGTFSVMGFSPANGHDGSAGFPGQGGGGGGASRGLPACRGASGGAGGLGGCGGGLGAGGAGGGASVALFSWASELTLVSNALTAATGGAGGAGGKGGFAGAGAAGGMGGGQNTALTVALGGDGGRGGNGGPGGNGSGGSGGPSYAIVYSTIQPTYTVPDSMLTSAKPSAAGEGGQQEATTKAPNGAVGSAGAELKAQ